MMDGPAVAVLWWDADRGFADAPAAWPADGTAVVAIRGQADRERARIGIRAALRAALAAACAVDAGRVHLDSAPGRAPRAVIDDGTPGGRKAWLAISHDGELSVAAWRFDGPVGIDVMQVQPVPDWQALARDYLGPAVGAALAALAPDAIPTAFAQAWSEHEARIKCLGRALEEWRVADAAVLEQCRCRALVLPEGYAGVLGLC